MGGLWHCYTHITKKCWNERGATLLVSYDSVSNIRQKSGMLCTPEGATTCPTATTRWRVPKELPFGPSVWLWGWLWQLRPKQFDVAIQIDAKKMWHILYIIQYMIFGTVCDIQLLKLHITKGYLWWNLWIWRQDDPASEAWRLEAPKWDSEELCRRLLEDHPRSRIYGEVPLTGL